MKYTNEKPTVPGWYWYKAAPYTPKTVVQIMWVRDRYEMRQGAEGFHPTNLHEDSQFAGPIPEPEE